MRSITRVAATAGLGLLLLGLAACGGSGNKVAASASTTSTTAARGAAFQAFRTCMANHGVTLPQRAPGTGTSGAGGGAGGTPTTDNPAAGGDGAGGGGLGGGGFGGGGALQPPPGVDNATYQAALSACRSLIPAGGPGGQQTASARKAYATCLSQHGVTVTTDAQGNPDLQGIDRTSPAFQAANGTCRALLPQRPQATTTTMAG